jgi:hypothetical protein
MTRTGRVQPLIRRGLIPIYMGHFIQNSKLYRIPSAAVFAGAVRFVLTSLSIFDFLLSLYALHGRSVNSESNNEEKLLSM